LTTARDAGAARAATESVVYLSMTGRDRGQDFSATDEACMAWLLETLAHAPALTEEQRHRIRCRLAQL